MEEASNYDVRKVPRGRCKECSCVGFDGSSSGRKKCRVCPHPPGKHVNLMWPGLYKASYVSAIDSFIARRHI